MNKLTTNACGADQCHFLKNLDEENRIHTWQLAQWSPLPQAEPFTAMKDLNRSESGHDRGYHVLEELSRLPPSSCLNHGILGLSVVEKSTILMKTHIKAK